MSRYPDQAPWGWRTSGPRARGDRLPTARTCTHRVEVAILGLRLARRLSICKGSLVVTYDVQGTAVDATAHVGVSKDRIAGLVCEAFRAAFAARALHVLVLTADPRLASSVLGPAAVVTSERIAEVPDVASIHFISCPAQGQIGQSHVRDECKWSCSRCIVRSHAGIIHTPRVTDVPGAVVYVGVPPGDAVTVSEIRPVSPSRRIVFSETLPVVKRPAQDWELRGVVVPRSGAATLPCSS